MNTVKTTHDIKAAATGAAVHELISTRFSPYAWTDQPVDEATLQSLFEAARWAPSAFNAQPARYIVATREEPEQFERLLAVLVEGNQAWAKQVPVLALGVVAKTFEHNGKTNECARHDLGLATANLVLEATARGLCVHQMAGIQPELAHETYGIPEGFEAVTGIAIGYADGTTDNERDRTPRSRRPLAESVFAGAWGDPAIFVE
ncbi:MAG TPA: nitroreductase family protein [Pseudomonadales bacterium]|nr:nitroreductase family protein [Pseudomonadales bacterium]